MTPTRVAPAVSSRELFGALVERELRLRAKKSWFGVGWPVLAPFFLLALYTFVFRSVLRVPIDDYPLFLLSGLLPWTFLSQSLGQAITSLSREPELIRRARFAYELLPTASVAVMGIYLLGNLAAFIVYLGATGRLSQALLPVLVVPLSALVLFTAAVAIVLALVDVYNRDLREVLGNLLVIWFFLVPIVYRQDMVTGRLGVLRSVDPMNLIVGQFRDILYWGQVSRPGHLLLMLVLCAGSLVISLTVFRRFAPQIPKEV